MFLLVLGVIKCLWDQLRLLSGYHNKHHTYRWCWEQSSGLLILLLWEGEQWWQSHQSHLHECRCMTRPRWGATAHQWLCWAVSSSNEAFYASHKTNQTTDHRIHDSEHRLSQGAWNKHQDARWWWCMSNHCWKQRCLLVYMCQEGYEPTQSSMQCGLQKLCQGLVSPLCLLFLCCSHCVRSTHHRV